jgi:hypothetical protein
MPSKFFFEAEHSALAGASRYGEDRSYTIGRLVATLASIGMIEHAKKLLAMTAAEETWRPAGVRTERPGP